MNNTTATVPPDNELVIARDLSVSPAALWRAWTTPALVSEWWTPRPWTTAQTTIDLRPGGVFATAMVSPDGQECPYRACFLEVVENRRIVLTTALGPGYHPAAKPFNDIFGFFTVVITLEPKGSGTTYTARVIHKDGADARKHAEMGFHEGWGLVISQLEEVARKVT